jgi:hypothetical protein
MGLNSDPPSDALWPQPSLVGTRAARSVVVHAAKASKWKNGRMRDRPPAANPKLVAWFGLETSPGAFTLRAETLVRRLQILPTKLSAATTKTALTFGARQTSKATMEDLAQSPQICLSFDLMGVYRFCRKTVFFAARQHSRQEAAGVWEVIKLGWVEGFEPSATGTTIRRSTS